MDWTSMSPVPLTSAVNRERMDPERKRDELDRDNETLRRMCAHGISI